MAKLSICLYCAKDIPPDQELCLICMGKQMDILMKDSEMKACESGFDYLIDLDWENELVGHC